MSDTGRAPDVVDRAHVRTSVPPKTRIRATGRGTMTGATRHGVVARELLFPEENFSEAGVLARQVASPISDMRGTVEFRVHLAGVLTQRTLALAHQRVQDS